MLVFPPGSTEALQGQTLLRAVLRSDLTPIPMTVELEVRDVPITQSMQVGEVVIVGRSRLPFRLVHEGGQPDVSQTQGAFGTGTRTFIGLLASCEALASPRQSAVVKYASDLGAIYRACGARVSIAGALPVPVFVCMRGHTPTFEVAKALQDAAGAIVCDEDGRISFRRLRDMAGDAPVRRLKFDSADSRKSSFVERHLVPFAFSTQRDGSFLHGRMESGRGVTFRPAATQDVLNNLSVALITRRKLTSAFAPDILAGMSVELEEKKFIVVTAAHTFEAGGSGASIEQSTTLWMGQVA